MVARNESPHFNGQGYMQGDGTLEVDKADKIKVLLNENDIEEEISARLLSIRGSYPYDPEYGSQIHTMLNKRTYNRALLKSYVLQALNPMILRNKIKDVKVESVKVFTKLTVSVEWRNPLNDKVTTIFNTFLY